MSPKKAGKKASKKVAKKVAKKAARKSSTKKTATSVAEFLDALDHPSVELARDLVASIRKFAPGLDEEIKWNAPSFAEAGDHRFTLNLSAADRVRLILHCGVKKKGLDMRERLGKTAPADLDWPAADRAVMTFRQPADLVARKKELAKLLPAWLETSRPS